MTATSDPPRSRDRRKGPSGRAETETKIRETMYEELKTIIEKAWEERSLLQQATTQEAVREVIELVDKGRLRTAEPLDEEKSEWRVNEWVKKAVILYFPMQPNKLLENE